MGMAFRRFNFLPTGRHCEFLKILLFILLLVLSIFGGISNNTSRTYIYILSSNFYFFSFTFFRSVLIAVTKATKTMTVYFLWTRLTFRFQNHIRLMKSGQRGGVATKIRSQAYVMSWHCLFWTAIFAGPMVHLHAAFTMTGRFLVLRASFFNLITMRGWKQMMGICQETHMYAKLHIQSIIKKRKRQWEEGWWEGRRL